MEASALEQRLERIESLLKALVSQKAIKSFYTTAEFADAVEKSDYTVREWCRNGRLKAQKKTTGRGGSLEWVVSQEELERYRQSGLLPTERNQPEKTS
jgi:hypothetical protein